MKPSNIESSIQALLDGELSAHEEQAIVTEIKNDPAVLKLYKEYASIDSCLTRLSSGQIPLSDESSSIIDASQKFHKRRKLTRILVAVAAISIAFLVTLKFILVEDEPLLVIKSAPDTHYTITHSNSKSTEPLKEGELIKGSKVDLTQGALKLTLSNGVTSIVQAPASFTLEEENQLHFTHGTAWFNVPSGAEGFIVTTPQIHVKDLGTEFGIISSDNANDEVHLLDGSIEVTSRNALGEKKTLNQTQAYRSSSTGKLEKTKLKKEVFLTSLPASGQPMIVFQETFSTSLSAWVESGETGKFQDDYRNDGGCEINTAGSSDHSSIHFSSNGKEIPATDTGYAAIGDFSTPPTNSLHTSIHVQEGRTYTIYFRYAGSHNANQKIRATMRLLSQQVSTGSLSCPDRVWKSASFTFTPTSSGIATLTFDDSGSSDHIVSDPLLDSVVVISTKSP